MVAIQEFYFWHLEFLKEFIQTVAQSHESKNGLTDMAAFNEVLYSSFPDQFVTGEPVHSQFKSFEVDRQDVYFVHK